MSANYLHGAETTEVKVGPRKITVVKSAVIGLVGTAPIFELDADNKTINSPKLILSDVDAGQYGGSRRTGYTIPGALDGIFDQVEDGKPVGVVVMINVFDPATHKTAVADEAGQFDADDALDTGHAGLASVVVKSSDGVTTYVVDEDYTVDLVEGIITRLSTGAIASEASVKLDYDYADPSQVTAADIVGTVDAAGDRTGLKALLDCRTLFGFAPKIIIAPGFSSQDAVTTEMDVVANSLRGCALVDAPVGTTFQEAIEGRGTSGTINFEYASERLGLCFPHLKAYNPVSEAEELEPYSARLAGAWSAKIIDKGYWWSPSNTEIKGITGTEIGLTAAINDPTSEVNLLNEKGIITVFHDYGTGRRTWGNRNASFPSASTPSTFLSVRMTADVIEESIELASLQFCDGPIEGAQMDEVAETINDLLRTLKSRKAILGGRCWWDPAKNTESSLAGGNVAFDYDFMPPPPAERFTFTAYQNTVYLNTLGGGGNV